MDINIRTRNNLRHSLTHKKLHNKQNLKRNSISRLPKTHKLNLPKKTLKKYPYFLPNKINGNLYRLKVNLPYQGKITVLYQ